MLPVQFNAFSHSGLLAQLLTCNLKRYTDFKFRKKKALVLDQSSVMADIIAGRENVKIAIDLLQYSAVHSQQSVRSVNRLNIALQADLHS